jgi:hypothetical protein
MTDEDGRTSVPGLFAGGDIATGAATVILCKWALGKKIGELTRDEIRQYLKNELPIRFGGPLILNSISDIENSSIVEIFLWFWLLTIVI